MSTENFEIMMNRMFKAIEHVVKIGDDQSLPVRQRLFTLKLVDEVLKSKSNLLKQELAIIEGQEIEEHRKTCPNCSRLATLPTESPPAANHQGDPTV